MDAYSAWLNDPQSVRRRLTVQNGDCSAKQGQNIPCGLGLRSEYPDARKFGWRILAYICKVQVERDEDAPLRPRGFDHFSVRLPAQLLIQDRVYVVTSRGK
jgi:hypothetical protein